MTFSAQVEQWRGLVASIWPASEVDNVLAVMQCESGGNPWAHNTVNEDSRGLLQINVGPGAHTQWASYDLFDPATNLQLAYQLWQSQGWAPWTCARNLGLVGGGGSVSGGAPAEDSSGLVLLAAIVVGLIIFGG